MSDDLINRLRFAEQNSIQSALGSTIFQEAADTIAALKRENERLARREVGLLLVLYDVSKGPSAGQQMRHWIEHCMTRARAALSTHDRQEG